MCSGIHHANVRLLPEIFETTTSLLRRTRPLSQHKTHKLDPLLRPRSIAVIGASEREDSVGCLVIRNLQEGGFKGPLFAVNPTRESVFGLPCYPDLSSLPQTVDQVIFAVADSRVEAALDDTIAHGASAITLFSTLILDEEETKGIKPDLRTRVKKKIRNSGLLACGANGMGYYNFNDGIWACGFDTRSNHASTGNVTLISHSGAGMSGIVDCEERIDFNLAVSTGQELGACMDQYMDYAIEIMDTRVIGLFMETCRNPTGFRAVLKKAADRKIPIVALKVGRTELAATLTVSHSGAVAGEDVVFQALFDRYGVQCVEDMDELTTTMIMFAQPHPVAEGGLVSLHDSGGERQLIIDLAERVDVPLTEISGNTKSRLDQLLDPGLLAINPLDAWSRGGPHYHQVMEKCFAALLCDEQAALGAVVHDRAPYGAIYKDYIGYLRSGHSASGKSVFLVANRQGTGSDPLVKAITDEGFPILDGLRSFLIGARCLMAYRDFQKRWVNRGSADSPSNIPEHLVSMMEKWKKRLEDGGVLDEFESGKLLRDFGVPVNQSHRVSDLESVIAVASEIGYPVVLKTAKSGLHHKTEQTGVQLDLKNEQELQAAYLEMSERLGPDALLSQMVSDAGAEMMLGMITDDQFGPLLVLGFGGIHVESLKDLSYALPPVRVEEARRLVDRLRQRPLLDSHRGMMALDIDAFCQVTVRLSEMLVCLGDVIGEIDVNPLLLSTRGCLALDALVVGKCRTDNETRCG